MSIKSENFSIFAEVELDTSKIQSQLNSAIKGAKFKVDSGNIQGLNEETEKLWKNNKEVSASVQDVTLTYQEANMILSNTIDIISSMVDQVFALDSSITE